MHLDKGLPEKFVFAVVKKDLAEELHKKRFDLVSEPFIYVCSQKVYDSLNRTMSVRLPLVK